MRTQTRMSPPVRMLDPRSARTRPPARPQAPHPAIPVRRRSRPLLPVQGHQPEVPGRAAGGRAHRAVHAQGGWGGRAGRERRGMAWLPLRRPSDPPGWLRVHACQGEGAGARTKGLPCVWQTGLGAWATACARPPLPCMPRSLLPPPGRRPLPGRRHARLAGAVLPWCPRAQVEVVSSMDHINELYVIVGGQVRGSLGQGGDWRACTPACALSWPPPPLGGRSRCASAAPGDATAGGAGHAAHEPDCTGQ
jgi:hypothetical protein